MSFSAAVANVSLVLATDPDPTNTTTLKPEEQLRPELTQYDVSPGLVGFLVMFVIAVATILLLLNLTKKLRKVSHDADETHRVEATFDGPGPRRSASRSGQESAGDVRVSDVADSGQ